MRMCDLAFCCLHEEVEEEGSGEEEGDWEAEYDAEDSHWGCNGYKICGRYAYNNVAHKGYP